VLSLAGRTVRPIQSGLPTRIGGFGGVEGLADYLRTVGVKAVVDATHPFAAQMSTNAVEACAAVEVPLARLSRPAWLPVPGDRWVVVPDIDAAAQALGPMGDRVFLTTGRQTLHAFAAMPDKTYLARTVDPIAETPNLPRFEHLQARGPFAAEAERDLMTRYRIDVLVTKNSGGKATAGKLSAARDLGLPVVMVDRPVLPPAHALASVDEAIRWLHV
jgi:precorrin-6A/cobalt-precorrin-6A reductase